MTNPEPAGGSALKLAALGTFRDRTTGGLHKALTAYVMAGTAASVGKAWYERAHAEVAYTVAVPGDDEIYTDLHQWVLARLPSNRQRALTARCERTNELTSDHLPARRKLALYYDGSRSQTLHLGEHRIRVVVERAEGATTNHQSVRMDEPAKPWGVEIQRMIFTLRSAAARDALLVVLAELTEARAARKEPRFFMADAWGSWTRRQDLPLRELSTVVLHKDQKEELMDDLDEFLRSADGYNRLGLPWHRGYLFEGPPGTGKTSLAKALAVHFHLDMYYAAVSSLQNDAAFLRLLSQVEPRSVLLLEDIDILHGAKVRDDDASGVSLSGLLNGLDGLGTPHGLITIMTTNDPSVLDDALLRPGRVDRTEHLGFVNDYQLAGLARVGLGRSVKLPTLRSKMVSPAAVVDVLKHHLDDSALAEHALRDRVAKWWT